MDALDLTQRIKLSVMFNLETFILLVSVSIKDTIIIKLNNALSTLIVVDVEL